MSLLQRLAGVPVLILANKQDVLSALGPEEIKEVRELRRRGARERLSLLLRDG